MRYTTEYRSPIGPLTLACDGEQLTGLWLQGQKYYGAGLSPDAEPCDGLPVFQQARQWLDQYFAGDRPPIARLPLRPMGSPFRQEVWRILRRIPYGQVTTYGDIARELAAGQGRPVSAQAVGGAVGHNPLSIIIPCHRVVGAGGSLTGYAGGVGKKLWLLTREGVDVRRLTVPKTGTAL